ncbi:MAG: hypothetical protein FVQ79_07015 [Planctomycetes bacterium]|nr:hypothetical protein [Planctomycetota bacterium]
MSVLISITVFVNSLMNALFRPLAGMMEATPGWLSNLIFSGVFGVVALVAFKYTSNQKAIGKVRDNIKAQLLAIKLFKDSMAVTLKAQGRLFAGSLLLLLHSLRPMLVMIIPFSLVLAQLGLWYQARPLMPGEQTIITIKVDAEVINDVKLQSLPGAKITAGPITAMDKNEINWQIEATDTGKHEITFLVDSQTFTKEMIVGEGLVRLNPVRPGAQLSQMLIYPDEKPFSADAPVKCISLDYPDRISKTCGTDWWIGYFFVISMIVALIFKPMLKVNI